MNGYIERLEEILVKDFGYRKGHKIPWYEKPLLEKHDTGVIILDRFMGVDGSVGMKIYLLGRSELPKNCPGHFAIEELMDKKYVKRIFKQPEKGVSLKSVYSLDISDISSAARSVDFESNFTQMLLLGARANLCGH